MGSSKSGEKSRRLEQRRLVMPCNDGAGNATPCARRGTEPRRVNERDGPRGRGRGGGGGGSAVEKGKKQLPSFIFVRTERKIVPGSTERESKEIKDVLATVLSVSSPLSVSPSRSPLAPRVNVSAIKVSTETKLPCRYYPSGGN